jgi:Flp pilus assembly pilin Flp
MMQSRQASVTAKNMFARLWHDDRGQDVVEYALLAAMIGLGSYGGFVLIQNTIHNSYIGWDTNQQNLWVPPNPGAYGS